MLAVDLKIWDDMGTERWMYGALDFGFTSESRRILLVNGHL